MFGGRFGLAGQQRQGQAQALAEEQVFLRGCEGPLCGLAGAVDQQDQTRPICWGWNGWGGQALQQQGRQVLTRLAPIQAFPHIVNVRGRDPGRGWGACGKSLQYSKECLDGTGAGLNKLSSTCCRRHLPDL